MGSVTVAMENVLAVIQQISGYLIGIGAALVLAIIAIVYKFYETAHADGMAGFDYDSAVMYPFGYGLSYTTFEQSLNSVTVSGATVTAQVTVTNTGSTAGKDVVQLYYDPPYTNGGIEKAAVNLIAFDKTDVLQAGGSE